MSIDQKYGFTAPTTGLSVPTDTFPQRVTERLLKTLEPLHDLWRAMDIDAFRQHGKVFLRITLDVGDRPLHLFVHEDGDVLQFDPPVMSSFPGHASHFVLTKLCGNNTYLSFRVDPQTSENAEGEDARQVESATEVLTAWGRFEFEAFLEMAPALLPYLTAKLTEAERDLRIFRDTPPPQVKLVA